MLGVVVDEHVVRDRKERPVDGHLRRYDDLQHNATTRH